MAEPRPVGALNFRDLGGLPAGPGRRLRPGVLCRSDSLQALTDADVTWFVHDLGVEAIVDLRTAYETIHLGRGPLAETTMLYLNAPFPESEPLDEPPEQQMLTHNLRFLRDVDAPTLPAVIRALAGLAGRPTVVHCAAGKDRTGLVIALVLRLAGVDDDAIVADYLASGPNMERVVERFRAWPHYRDHMASVPPEIYRAYDHTIKGVLHALDEEFGGVRGWARARGLDDALLDRFASHLLEPTP